jgi:hypothetical protein
MTLNGFDSIFGFTADGILLVPCCLIECRWVEVAHLGYCNCLFNVAVKYHLTPGVATFQTQGKDMSGAF